jgi:hypothetical protein
MRMTLLTFAELMKAANASKHPPPVGTVDASSLSDLAGGRSRRRAAAGSGYRLGAGKRPVSDVDRRGKGPGMAGGDG